MILKRGGVRDQLNADIKDKCKIWRQKCLSRVSDRSVPAETVVYETIVVMGELGLGFFAGLSG